MRRVIKSAGILLVLGLLAFANTLHEQVLHSQVRVRTDTAGGSGTVIYAKKVGDFWSCYIVSCHHVIENALQLDTKWDPLLQKDRKRELRKPVLVEFFEYGSTPHGKPPLTSGATAEIVAYDPQHDIVLLHVRLAKKPPVAKMLPPGRIESIVVGSPVVAVGCALLHDPILTQGIVTHQVNVIDYADYWMSNAQIIFGNSGGAVFAVLPDGYFFIGIPSRIDVTFGTPITHLGHFSPISRVYRFFDEQMFGFLTPGSDKTEAQCAEERKTKRDLEEQKLRQ